MLKKPIWIAIERTLFYYSGHMYRWSSLLATNQKFSSTFLIGQALYERSLIFLSLPSWLKTQNMTHWLGQFLRKDTLLKSRIYMPTNIIREKSISLKLCVGIPRVFKVWTHAEIPTSKNYILKSYLRYLFQTPQLLLLSMQRPARFITSQRLFYIVSGKKDFFWLAWLLGLIWLNLYIKVISLIMF